MKTKNIEMELKKLLQGNEISMELEKYFNQELRGWIYTEKIHTHAYKFEIPFTNTNIILDFAGKLIRPNSFSGERTFELASVLFYNTKSKEQKSIKVDEANIDELINLLTQKMNFAFDLKEKAGQACLDYSQDEESRDKARQIYSMFNPMFYDLRQIVKKLAKVKKAMGV